MVRVRTTVIMNAFNAFIKRMIRAAHPGEHMDLMALSFESAGEFSYVKGNPPDMD
jgi:hypothetical protein